MSFGFSLGDAVLLTQLAGRVIKNARKACGEYDDLSREVTSLHRTLQRLQQEKDKSGSMLNNPCGGHGQELQTLIDGCGEVLKKIDKILKGSMLLETMSRLGTSYGKDSDLAMDK